MSQNPAAWFTRPARPLVRAAGVPRQSLSGGSRRPARRLATRLLPAPPTTTADTTAPPITLRAGSVPVSNNAPEPPPVVLEPAAVPPSSPAPAAVPLSTNTVPNSMQGALVSGDAVGALTTVLPATIPLPASPTLVSAAEPASGTARFLPSIPSTPRLTATRTRPALLQRSPSTEPDSDDSAASTNQRLALAMDRLVTEAEEGDIDGAIDRAFIHLGSVLGPVRGRLGPLDDVDDHLQLISYCAQLVVSRFLCFFFFFHFFTKFLLHLFLVCHC